MIRHTVAFSLVHPAGSAAEADFLNEARNTLSSIPGTDGFEVSRQVSPKSDFSFQFAMSFDDEAAYEAYNTHPHHVRFVETRWATDVFDFQELDFTPLPS